MEPEEPEDDGNDDECLDDGDAIDTDEDMDDNICTCSTMRGRIKGADSTINAIPRTTVQ